MITEDTDLYGDEKIVVGRVLAATEGFDSLPAMPVPDICRGATYYRELPNGRCIVLYVLIPGTVRITVGDVGSNMYDDAWCYASLAAGVIAASCWDGEGDPPEGWFRNIGSARRRPEGDPEREYVAR